MPLPSLARFVKTGSFELLISLPRRPSFVLKQKKQKFKRQIARRPVSFRWRNQKNSPAAQTAFDFCAIFKQQVPACAIKARSLTKKPVSEIDTCILAFPGGHKNRNSFPLIEKAS